MIQLAGVSKQYKWRGPSVLKDVSASFPPRCRTLIWGPPASGKTTLLKLLCGMEVPTAGSVHRQMSVSFPIGNTLKASPVLTVRDFLRFVARMYRADFDELRAFTMEHVDIAHDYTARLCDIGLMKRRRMSILLGYALAFDCYLFDDAIAPSGREVASIYDALFETRSAVSATVLATKSLRLFRRLSTPDAIMYVFHDARLVRCRDFADVREFANLCRSADAAALPVRSSYSFES